MPLHLTISPEQALKPIKAIVNLKITDLWNKEWLETEQCRQTKIWFPRVNLAKSKELVLQTRSTYSRLVRFLTGHCFLRAQNFKLGISYSPLCRVCGNDNETPVDLISDCDPLCHKRWRIFDNYLLCTVKPDWSVRQIAKFTALPIIKRLDETLEDSSNLSTP